MRAIGAQRRFVLVLVVVEVVTIGLVFGGLGAALGIGSSSTRSAGLAASPPPTTPCTSSSPGRPSSRASARPAVVASLVIVVLVSILSALYPAFLAMRVTPARGHAIGRVMIATRPLHRLAQPGPPHAGATCCSASAIGGVTAMLVLLGGLTTGMREAMLALGHHAHDRPRQRGRLLQDHQRHRRADGDRLPEKSWNAVKGQVPELDLRRRRAAAAGPRWWPTAGRWTSSWAASSWTGSRDSRRSIQVVDGSLAELGKPGTILLFQEQAKRLGVKRRRHADPLRPHHPRRQQHRRRAGRRGGPQHRAALGLQRLHARRRRCASSTSSRPGPPARCRST